MSAARACTTPRHWPALLWLLLHAGLLAPVAVVAQEHAPPLSRYQHTAWTLQDGAPADIWAIAQAADGYLWLGTGFGLYRFDGVHFERLAPSNEHILPSNNITALTITAAGDVWIGYHGGGVSRLRGQAFAHYGPDADAPVGMVYRIVHDPADDAVWVAAQGGLFRFDDAGWRKIGADHGYHWPVAEWLLLDTRGALWVATGDVLAVLPRGATRFTATGIGIGAHAVLDESADGRIWVSDSVGGTRPVRIEGGDASRGGDPDLHAVAAKRLLFLRDGTLWGTDAVRGGAFRMQWSGSPGAIATTARPHLQRFGGGLTGDVAGPLLEDREGNVWIGTNLGLSRFRYRNAIALPGIAGPALVPDTLLRDADGSVIVSTRDGLFRANRASVQRLIDGTSIADESARTRVTTWLAVEGRRLYRVRDGEHQHVPMPAGAEGLPIAAMADDHAGNLWVSLHGHGVHRYRHGAWVAITALPAPAPTVIAPDLQGRLWFGYPDSRVAVLDGGRVREYGRSDGLDVGHVTAISVGRRHALVAGEAGLARMDGERFASLPRDGDVVFTGVTGILEADADLLWFNGSGGVVRVAGTELREALASGRGQLQYALFGPSDGVPGVALQAALAPTAMNNDGLFLFATNQGIALIDPERIRSNPVPPPVLIRSVVAGQREYSADAAVALPKGTTNLQVAYTATSLTAPERIRFRYQLVGVDPDWQEAGGRREAFYTNLEPGRYTFRVIAANDWGVWNEQGATLELRIAPTFFQTPWFALACASLFAGALYAAYLLHLRQMAVRMRARLEERHLERERIARELHDTLLQGFQGLILRLHALVGQLHTDEPLKPRLERAMDQAESVLVEGRDRVRELRAATRMIDDLPAALAGVCEEFAAQSATRCSVNVAGVRRRLQPMVRDELYRIGREAIANAFHHARALNLDIQFVFARDAFTLVVRDDGTGIAPDILARGGSPGHWGLSGMRERAERIDGRFAIDSRVGAGTGVTVTLHGAAAYRERGRRGWLQGLLARRRGR